MKLAGFIIFFQLAFLNVFSFPLPGTLSDSIQYYMNHFRYTRALELINNSLSQGGDLKESYILKGRVLKANYAYAGSLDAFIKAYSFDSTDIAVIMEIANAYRSLQDYDNAAVFFGKGLSFDSTNPYFATEIANCEYLDKKYDRAKEDFLRLYRSDTTNYFVITKIAWCCSKLDLTDSSLVFFEKASLLNPSDPVNVLAICNLSVNKKDYKYGIRKSEAFLEADSTDPSINEVNAYLYMLDRQYRKSIRQYGKCIRLNDTSRIVYKNTGIDYFKVGASDTAKKYLEKAYFKDTLDITTLHYLGLACSQSYYKQAGVIYLEKAIRLCQPEIDQYAQIHMNLVAACQAWGNCPCEKALSASLKALELNPGENKLLLSIAIGYKECYNNKPKAIEYLERLLESKPSKETTKKADQNTLNDNAVSYSMYKYAEYLLKELKRK